MEVLNIAVLNQVSGGDTALNITTHVADANNALLTSALGNLLLGELTPETLAAVIAAAQVHNIVIGNFTITHNTPVVPVEITETIV